MTRRNVIFFTAVQSVRFFFPVTQIWDIFFPSCCCALISSGNVLSALRDTTQTESFSDKVGTAEFDRELEND